MEKISKDNKPVPEIFNLWAVLATIVAAISLFKFVATTLDIGVWAVLLKVLDYYSSIALWIFQYIPSLIDLNIPNKTAEGWALCFIQGGCVGRAFIKLAAPEDARKRLMFISLVILVIIVSSLTMVTGMIGAFSQVAFFHPRYRKEAYELLFRKSYNNNGLEIVVTLAMIYWVLTILIMLAFFVLNAFAPSG
ncbi:membrane hypothetical protein [Alteromonas sp. 38]|uniref:hypothetical protein n=1 Tax=Alteromonas TaxID=226 RepID=UPI0012F1BE3F|nr:MULTISPECIES: hypothetical protein [Alteromonas]CAD5275965.1 membrane hypothetical protein [Alteromonas sp. 154]VXB67119.1 membrane hypothetical protein [Alteromonas sp. 38]